MKHKYFILLALIFSMLPINMPLSVKAEEKAAVSAGDFIEMLTGTELKQKEEDYISRRGFIDLLTDIMKVGEVEIPEQIFNDVKKESESAGKIYAALDLNWISAGELFRPDDDITLYEALCVYIRAMGYETEADMRGGYPMGYYYIAADFDILKDIGKSGYDKLTYGDVFNITENFLNAEFKSKEYRNGKWTRTTQTTLLSKLYNMQKIEGIVTSVEYNYNTAFENGEEILTIGINGNIYSCTADDGDFLGYSVKAYCMQDEDTVVYIEKTDKNTEAEYLRKNIETDGNRVTIYNEETGKESRIKLAGAFDLYYNGENISEDKLKYIEGKSGKIKFLDNNRDGVFEVVFAEDYKYVTVKSINLSTNEMILDESGDKNAIDLSKIENDYTKVITSNGTALLKDISDGEILAAAISPDNRRIKLYLCDNRKRGHLSSYNKQTGEMRIDDTLYTVSEYFTDRFANAMSAGKEYVFTIGIDGNVVYAEFTPEMSYGYLTKIYKDDTSDDVICKIFTENGEFIKAKCAGRIRADGVSVKSEIGKVTAAVSGEQLIRYKFNNSGEISEIDTASQEMPEYLGQPQNESNKLTRFNADGEIPEYTYRSEISMFYPAFNASSSKVFLIPKSGNEEDYETADSSVFVNDTVYSIDEIIPYDVGADGTAKAVVYKYNEGRLKLDSSSVMVFIDEAEYVDDNNDEYTKIDGWSSGTFKTIYLSSDKSIESKGKTLETGDIIRYKTLNGKVRRVVMDFDASEEVFAETGVSSDAYFNGKVKYSSLQFQSGQVYSYDNGFIYLSSVKDSAGNYDFSYKNLRNFGCDTDNIILVDRKNKTVLPGTRSDIRSYIDSKNKASTVVLVQSYLVTKQVIIYVG